MIEPKLHEKENERIKNLKSYSILDTLPEDDYDNLTAIAAQICDTPISLVSLIDSDRQWFKSHHGTDTAETPREYAFCGHAINQPDEILLVQDSRKDKRFHDNPLVINDPHVIFYAGIPLISDQNLPLGTLCVIDHKPRNLNQNQLDSLKALSKQLMNLFELRKNKLLLEETINALEKAKIGRKAMTYVLIVAVVLLIISEAIVEPKIEIWTAVKFSAYWAFWVGLFLKLIIAFLIKPGEMMLERRFLKSARKEAMKQKT